MNCSEPTERKLSIDTEKFKTYSMGLQASCGMDTEIQKEGSLWGIASRTGRGIQGAGKAEGEQDRIRASAAGLYAHDGIDIAQIFCSAGGRVHKGEKCDTKCTETYEPEEEFYWRELLGQRLRCVYSREG